MTMQVGAGTQWVAYRNIDKYCEYFDSFGLKMPTDVHRSFLSSAKQLVYSKDEIQERDSVLCGYRSFSLSRNKKKINQILSGA